MALKKFRRMVDHVAKASRACAAPVPRRPVHLVGVILAGGESRRMGRDKASLGLEGRSLLAWTADRLRPVCRKLVVSAREPAAGQALGLPVLPDQTDRIGPAGGILTALRALSRDAGRAEAIFICGCDMPFVSAALVRHMASRLAGRRAVACRTARGLEPLHAVWSPAALPVAEELIAGGTHAARKILDAPALEALVLEPAEWRTLDPEGRSFFNINSPEDLAQAQAWLAEACWGDVAPPDPPADAR